MNNPTEIYKTCSEGEKKLSELRLNQKANRKEISDVVVRLCSDYEVLLIRHPIFAASRNIHGLLWKHCFYRDIEEHRGKIQKTVSLLSGKSDPGLVLQAKAKMHLMRLSSSLHQHLLNSTSFYTNLQKNLQDIYVTDSDLGFRAAIVDSVYRCLLYLGDLARYRQLYSDEKEKSYVESANYYRRAGTLLPSNGNFLNQLAVLALYDKNDVYAVYYYCRSLLVQDPFLAAYGNLRLLFEKGAKSFDPKLLTALPPPPSEDTRSSRLVQHFPIKFIKVHGMLFKLAENLQLARMSLNSIRLHIHSLYTKMAVCEQPAEKNELRQEIEAYIETCSSRISPPVFDSGLFEELVQSCLVDLDPLCSRGAEEGLLEKLLVIYLFSTHFTSLLGKPLSTYRGGSKGPVDGERRDLSKLYEALLLAPGNSEPSRDCFLPEVLATNFLISFINRYSSPLLAITSSLCTYRSSYTIQGSGQVGGFAWQRKTEERGADSYLAYSIHVL